MFNKEKKTEEKAAKREYVITVDAARLTKKDSIVMVDLDVNGVKIKSCMLKEITVSKDGEKYKKGDITYVLNFPSEKGSDGKYYNRVWFPASKEMIENICSQVEDLIK